MYIFLVLVYYVIYSMQCRRNSRYIAKEKENLSNKCEQKKILKCLCETFDFVWIIIIGLRKWGVVEIRRLAGSESNPNYTVCVVRFFVTFFGSSIFFACFFFWFQNCSGIFLYLQILISVELCIWFNWISMLFVYFVRWIEIWF